ncbi:MARVEL domain-containing protein 3 [Meleagris gallopavo]|uniref:MARVEL domain-containing protein 3 n=1 Tax=Meleagris gallopavo TaxID=9103 RepID=UPI000549A1B7|nr:MARVEL domain-containing protein 3 [Meleagris gallopavo]
MPGQNRSVSGSLGSGARSRAVRRPQERRDTRRRRTRPPPRASSGPFSTNGSVSYGSAGGYTGVPGQGGIYYYMYGGAYSGFSGADGEKAQQLDRRFTQLKMPIARAAMAVGGALLVFSSALIVVGVVRLPWRFPAWLLLEGVLDAAVAVGLLFALYYFFHHLLGVYDSSVCKERAHLYQSKGYQGFSCSMHGAEIAAGLLGCAAVVAFLLGAGLAVRGYRLVHKLKQKPEHVYEP